MGPCEHWARAPPLSSIHNLRHELWKLIFYCPEIGENVWVYLFFYLKYGLVCPRLPPTCCTAKVGLDFWPSYVLLRLQVCTVTFGFVSYLDVNILLEFDKFPFVTFNSACIILEKGKIHWLITLVNLLSLQSAMNIWNNMQWFSHFILYVFFNFYFMCLSAFPQCMSVHNIYMPCVSGVWKKELDSCNLIWMVGSHHWVLGTERRSSVRAISGFKNGAISPGPLLYS